MTCIIAGQRYLKRFRTTSVREIDYGLAEKMLLEWSEEGDVGCGRSSSNEGLPGISRFSVFYRDVHPDRHAKRGRFFLGKNVNTSVNGERALAPYFL